MPLLCRLVAKLALLFLAACSYPAHISKPLSPPGDTSLNDQLAGTWVRIERRPLSDGPADHFIGIGSLSVMPTDIGTLPKAPLSTEYQSVMEAMLSGSAAAIATVTSAPSTGTTGAC